MDKRHIDYVSAAIDNRYKRRYKQQELETPETDFEAFPCARGALGEDRL